MTAEPAGNRLATPETVAGVGDSGPASPRPATTPAADDPPSELIDAAADDAALGDEDLERGVPAPLATERPRPSDVAPNAGAPSVSTMAARIPAATRGLLSELFKAEISTVRRISRDQLR